jgi:hypothetical protein
LHPARNQQTGSNQENNIDFEQVTIKRQPHTRKQYNKIENHKQNDTKKQ